jgi:hypothetical protein
MPCVPVVRAPFGLRSGTYILANFILTRHFLSSIMLLRPALTSDGNANALRNPEFLCDETNSFADTRPMELAGSSSPIYIGHKT